MIISVTSDVGADGLTTLSLSEPLPVEGLSKTTNNRRASVPDDIGREHLPHTSEKR
jgi:hypothetical protein